jgi:hypothetical protein
MIKRIKLKREIKKIRNLRDKVLNIVAEDSKISDAVEREVELTKMLFDIYFDYKTDPEKISKELKEKLNVDDELNNLQSRLARYYDRFDKSATATIYVASNILK